MKKKNNLMLLALLSIIIVAISYALNFGFVRLLGLITLIPFVHAVLVLIIGITASKYSEHKRIRLYNILFSLTYVLSNVFYPDADEVSGHMFFGLIENSFMCNLGEVVSIVALIVHVFLLVLQLIEISRAVKTE
ncbi:MAG: hypothetical protein IJC69_02265 [Clostridia bacterium]|nr:hypothetical protein [Clostridia bacterium]